MSSVGSDSHKQPLAIAGMGCLATIVVALFAGTPLAWHGLVLTLYYRVLGLMLHFRVSGFYVTDPVRQHMYALVVLLCKHGH